MSLFNQLVRGSSDCYPSEKLSISGMQNASYQPRTFKETIADQIAFHAAKIRDLEAVRDSLTPEVEKFVEAIQKIS